MPIQIPELKIKLKSLAEESRIIRREELKYKHNIRKVADLYDHRKHHVRPIARATHIAYGLLRGLEYNQIEPTSKTTPHWGKVRSMVKKYSNFTTEKDNLLKLDEWEFNNKMLKAA